MILNDVFMECVNDPGGIVSVASTSAEGKPHIANTWNKYLVITEKEEILIPCFGFRKTEKNGENQPYMEIVIGSDKVQGKMGMGTGFLLTGTARFEKEGEYLDRVKDKLSVASRVLVFTPETCKQTI